MKSSVPRVARVKGILRVVQGGFGFIETEDGKSFFVEPKLAKVHVSEDIVEFFPCVDIANNRTMAQDVRLVYRQASYWMGEAKHTEDGGLTFVSDDPLYAKVRLPSGTPYVPGDVLQVVLPEVHCRVPQVLRTSELSASVAHNIGPRTTPNYETVYAITKWRLPHQWPDEVLAEVTTTSDTQNLLINRQPLPHQFVTIDGESTKDFDDAIFIQKTAQGYVLFVAIADVSAYVPPQSALDAEARVRGTSVYFPDRTLPMLPNVLSTGLCSLVPNEVRPALICCMTLSSIGELDTFTFSTANIVSAARLTYSQTSAFLMTGEGIAEPIQAQIRLLQEFATACSGQRAKRGLGREDHQDPKIKKDANGMYTLEWEPASVANIIVEECMLLANQAAATYLKTAGNTGLYRSQPGVDSRKWGETKEWLATQGIAVGDNPTLPELQTILHTSQGHPMYPGIKWRVMRSFSQAHYDIEHSAHYSLAVDAYTHFTSPIRRYSDLLVHRLIKAELNAVTKQEADLCTETSRRAHYSSRYSWDYLKKQSLWKSNNKEVQGEIAGVSKRGVRVAILGWEVAVMITEEWLARSGYKWEPKKRQWKGSHAFECGFPLRVKLTGYEVQGASWEITAQLINQP